VSTATIQARRLSSAEAVLAVAMPVSLTQYSSRHHRSTQKIWKTKKGASACSLKRSAKGGSGMSKVFSPYFCVRASTSASETPALAAVMYDCNSCSTGKSRGSNHDDA
jgi:hypothetical protein